MGNLSASATFWTSSSPYPEAIFYCALADEVLPRLWLAERLGKGGRCVGGISIRAFYTARPKAGKSELIVANAEFR
jgi:hypothetical protein